MKVGEHFTLVDIRSAGYGNWGWPTCLVLTLRTEDGEDIEAIIQVDQWHKPKTKAQSE